MKVLEVGFGTGLNALLTALDSDCGDVEYTALEPFPVDSDLINSLNYPALMENEGASEVFRSIHNAEWGLADQITDGFSIQKQNQTLQEFDSKEMFDLVYYDAFASHAQPELWEPSIWAKLYDMVAEGGVLVTYCAKGQVRKGYASGRFRYGKTVWSTRKERNAQGNKTTKTMSRYNIRVYGILINEKSEVLLSDERYGGLEFTKFPGGGLEKGEGLIDCLKREFLEELDLEINVVSHLYTTDFYQVSAFDKEQQLLSIYYLVKAAGEMKFRTATKPFDFEDASATKSESHRWIPMSQLAVDVFRWPVDKHVCKMINNQFKKADKVP